MSNDKKSSVDREIPETEKLGLEIESSAAAVFAPDSKPEQIETLVRMVNRRAHLTVKTQVAAIEKFNRRRQLMRSIRPVQIKLRSIRNRLALRRVETVGE